MATTKVKCYAKFYKNGEMVSNINSTSFRGFKTRFTGYEFDKVAIKIVYGKDLENSGTFYDLKTARQFMDGCSEPKLLEFIRNGQW